MGNLIRPPFCLFPAQTRQPPISDWALPEGQPHKRDWGHFSHFGSLCNDKSSMLEIEE